MGWKDLPNWLKGIITSFGIMLVLDLIYAFYPSPIGGQTPLLASFLSSVTPGNGLAPWIFFIVFYAIIGAIIATLSNK